MKKIIFCSLFTVHFSLFTFSHPPAGEAGIYMAKTCEISFFSESPLENIEAINRAAKPILNTATGDIQIKIPISGFVFPKPLMQEHFNENYMETDQEGPKDTDGKPTYPNKNSIFKGKINESVDYSKDGEFKVTVTGKLSMHGVEKDRTFDGTLTVKGSQIILQTKFMIHVSDYNIKVPSLYVKNIAEDVSVKLNATLELFKK